MAVLVTVQAHTRIHFFLYAAIGTITCVAVGYIASLLLPARKRSIDGLTIHTMAPRHPPAADPASGRS